MAINMAELRRIVAETPSADAKCVLRNKVHGVKVTINGVVGNNLEGIARAAAHGMRYSEKTDATGDVTKNDTGSYSGIVATQYVRAVLGIKAPTAAAEPVRERRTDDERREDQERHDAADAAAREELAALVVAAQNAQNAADAAPNGKKRTAAAK